MCRQALLSKFVFRFFFMLLQDRAVLEGMGRNASVTARSIYEALGVGAKFTNSSVQQKLKAALGTSPARP